MLFKGTKSRNNEELNEALEGLGGEYNAYTDFSSTVYSITALEEELENAIELLSDMLLNSNFPKEEIDIIYNAYKVSNYGCDSCSCYSLFKNKYKDWVKYYIYYCSNEHTNHCFFCTTF